MLPELSGIEVLKEMRARAETRMVPVILLTARREEIDRVLGLELGADDYVTKPFSARELVLRIRGLLKRGERRPTRPRERCGSGRSRSEPADHRAVVGGKAMSLTLTEFRLLEDLIRAKGRVRTRETLLVRSVGLRFRSPLAHRGHPRPASPLEAADRPPTGWSPCAASAIESKTLSDPR